MAATKLDKSDWQLFFDRLSKSLTGKRADIEVASLALGHQVEAKYLPLLGVVYDRRNDVIEIALEGLDHIAHKPRELFIDMSPAGLISIDIIDGDGVQQIVKLRDPLVLPAPATTAKAEQRRV
jgi:hypothetical protein